MTATHRSAAAGSPLLMTVSLRVAPEHEAAFTEFYHHRYSSNADWDQWVGKTITWQDASSFRPIFRS